MQIFQDTKSSANPSQPDTAVSGTFGNKHASDNPDRDVMCLVFSDGTVRTVNPKPQTS